MLLLLQSMYVQKSNIIYRVAAIFVTISGEESSLRQLFSGFVCLRALTAHHIPLLQKPFIIHHIITLCAFENKLLSWCRLLL